jgi:hypothetical protein
MPNPYSKTTVIFLNPFLGAERQAKLKKQNKAELPKVTRANMRPG